MAAVTRVRSCFPLLQRRCYRATRELHLAAAAVSVSGASQARAAPLLRFRGLALSACRLRSAGDFTSGREAGLSPEDDGDVEEREVEELFQQQTPAGAGDGRHRVFVVHPDVKWGSRKQHLTSGKTRHADTT